VRSASLDPVRERKKEVGPMTKNEWALPLHITIRSV